MPEGAQGLPPADIHRLRAAQGWTELGLPSEAARELQGLSPDVQTTPLALDVRWSVSNALGDWDLSHRVASLSVQLHPDHEPGWINRSYAARRMPDGGIPLALEQLLPALERFPDNSLIPYNLACYACRLDDLARAMEWFAIARKRDVRTATKPGIIMKLALNDPDLVPIRAWIRSQG